MTVPDTQRLLTLAQAELVQGPKGDKGDKGDPGSVASVNGDPGPDVVLTAADVGAASTAQGAKADTAVQPARTIATGTGLTGGGDLSADRTLAVSYGTAAGTAAQGNDSRITGAAQKAANLSDLASASTALGNLGGVPTTRTVSGKALSANVTLAPTDVGAAARTQGGAEAVAALSATTGTATGNCANASVFTVTPTGNITLAFSNVPAAGAACTVTVVVTQGATVRTVALPSGGVWLGSAPTQTASKACIVTLLTVDGGTTWYASGAVQA